MEKKSIVVIGGGTGTHALLRGLATFADRVSIAAIVTMADSGGSTGRLRDEFGYLPVGDARSALAALAYEYDGEEDLLRKLFLHRFHTPGDLSGHTFGNLFLVALTDILGSEAKAIEAAGHILRTVGEVIPVTEDNVHLTATYSTGEVAHTEHEIDVRARAGEDARVTTLALSRPARANPRALQAIEGADLIVLGPGDLYTSILANCIVEGMGNALSHASAPLLYVSNLMSRTGQTSDMGTADYLGELERYIGRLPSHMLLHTGAYRPDLLHHYAQEHEYPVRHTYANEGVQVITGDFVSMEDVVLSGGDTLKRSLIRHDGKKLAAALVSLVSHA